MPKKRKINLFDEQLKDLGFGAKVTQQSRLRLLNHDGSFNVVRTGISFVRSLSFYHALLTMSWWKFHLIIVISYFSINAFFAIGFLLTGPEAIHGAVGQTLAERFGEAFFYSVQTFTSVGYGHLTPNGFVANVLATFDAFVGLLGFALATGLLFARFSRPSAKIMFSDSALIASYRNKTAFEFRIANERNSQLIDVGVKVLLARRENVNGLLLRRFYELPLERNKVTFMPLHWTVVHPIDDNSPLFGLTEKDLTQSEAEILILVTAIDDIYSQTVHARSSYRYDEIVWNAKFSNMFQASEDDILSVDMRRLHKFELLEMK